jgi:hypothetical protein
VAKYNEILVGRFNNALKKFLGMKGPAPAPQAAGEIGATIPFYWGVENRFLEEWSRFGSYNQIAAGGAGTFASLRLRNPPGSNVIAVVEKVRVMLNQANAITIALAAQAADLTTIIATATRLDPRHRPSSSSILSSGVPVAAPPLNIWISSSILGTGDDAILDENQEIPVLPGDALTIACSAPNVLLNGSLFWRERFLEDSERA